MSRCVRTVTVTFSNYTRQRKQLDCTALLNSLHPACSLVKDSLTLHLIENQNSTNSVYNIRKVKPMQKCLKLASFWTGSRSYFMRKLWFSDSSAWAAHTQHVGSQLAVSWQSMRQIQTQSTCRERFLSDRDSLWVTLARAVAGPSASWGEETSPSLPLSTNYHSTDAQCHPHHALGCWDFGKLHKSNGGYWYFINNQLAFHSTIKQDML